MQTNERKVLRLAKPVASATQLLMARVAKQQQL